MGSRSLDRRRMGWWLGRWRRVRWWRRRRRFRRLRRRWRLQRRRRGGQILMLDAVERVVSPFLERRRRALGNGYSAVLYGSAARGDYVPEQLRHQPPRRGGRSVTRELRALGPAFAAWQKSRPSRRCSSPVPNGSARRTCFRSRSPTCARRTGCCAAPIRWPGSRSPGRIFARRWSASSGASCCASGRGTPHPPASPRRSAAGPSQRRHDAGVAPRSADLLGRTGARAIRSGSPWPRRGARRRQRVAAACRTASWRSRVACGRPEHFEPYMDAAARAARFIDQLQLGDQ